MANATDITQRYTLVREQIASACVQAKRDTHSVALLAVSKFQPASAVRAVAELGQRDFGENYVQEALAKQAELSDLSVCWHLIGPLQSNKTAEVAKHFDWVHSVDRLKIAQRLSAQRPAGLAPLNVCIQVNIDNQDSKSGCDLVELPSLVDAIVALPRLRLRGLMCIPAPGNHQALHDLAKTHADLLARLPQPARSAWDTLSMGMSDDLTEAIAAGSTLVRVGTAIFGARTRPQE